MSNETTNPLIIQSDNSLLLEVNHPLFESCRNEISFFTELEKSPEHIHTFRITPLSLWNAASSGIEYDNICAILKKYSRYDIPEHILENIEDLLNRWGELELYANQEDDLLYLKVKNREILLELEYNKSLKSILQPCDGGFTLSIFDRGISKAKLIKLGYPVKDMAPLKEGDPLEINLKKVTSSNKNLEIRDYQEKAVNSLLGNNQVGNGYGTIVMPCGSGKTIVGIAAMTTVKNHTLIITPNVASVHQWKAEILDKTDLSEDDIGEYSGEVKEIKPVTIATYQILTWRKDKESDFPHFHIFRENNWGFIIYDEVHLLPAPVFRVTAEIQAIKRVGLTATLIREDGNEDQVFSLVGPKKFDVPWKELEKSGWIAEALCTEIRISLPKKNSIEYATADKRKKFRIASENSLKYEITKELLDHHKGESILIIGQYITQLTHISKMLGVPLITGKMAHTSRDELYSKFRNGEIKVLVVSKVANFAIDLPDASVAIQLSGTFGSRQEEAQRLGRILRPKEKPANFYTLITRRSVEEEFGMNRQKFLTEQGYKYKILIREEESIGK